MRQPQIIGKKITIIKSKNKTLQGKQGVVIDETKNTIIIKEKGQKKTIIKEQVTIEIEGKKHNIPRLTIPERIKVQKK